MQLLEGHPSAVLALTFSAAGHLAAGHRGGRLTCWTPAGDVARRFDPSAGLAADCQAADFSPAGDRIAFGVGPAWWDEPVPPEPKALDLHTPARLPPAAEVTAVRFVGPGLVAVGTGLRAKPTAGFVELWDLAAGGPRKPRHAEPHGVRAVAAHPPTRRVAWANGSRRVTVWDVSKPDPVHLSLKDNSPAVEFAPDGSAVAVAHGWEARVVDLASKRDRAVMKGHKGQVAAVAFGPDGRTLVTGGWDATVRLWDADTGAERHTFQWPTGRVYAVAYAPDGTRLAAAGESGTVVVWDAD